MFPFFKPKGAMGSVLILDRNASDDKPHDNLSDLEAAMKPLLDAMEAKDVRAMAQAFSDAFQIADLSPHDEYDHEDDDYETEEYD